MSSVGALKPSILPKLITPMPMKKTAGFVTAIYSGTNPKLSAKGLKVDVSFSGKARGGGDLRSFMKVTLPPNSGVRPTTPPPDRKVQVSFKSGDSALTQAKKLEAALKAQAGAGYGISRNGTTVHVQMYLMA